MREVTNLRTQPITLEDGTILAAAGSAGSTKPVGALSDRDERRLVRRRMISVVDKSLKVVSDAPPARASSARAPKEASSSEGGQ
ncbi:MAG TPA: hypothetical protein VJU84_08590 [Pyrinomonadaceae bacterium]|nr:hypothetical protein [Pyrinomonadaceae bacterium]